MRSVSLALMVVVVLCLVGVGANADTVDPSAGSSAVPAAVQPAGQVDAAASASATEAGADGPAAGPAVPPAGQVGATASGQPEKKKKISISVEYSAFLPSDGETRENFGKVWSGIGIGLFRVERPKKLAFEWDFSWLSKHGKSDALLVPVTVGVLRGLSRNPDRQPYVAVRLGPYYGKVDDNREGPDETKIGGNVNVAVGLIIDRKYLLEARYDWFTTLAGNNFNGLTLTAGVKVYQFSY